MTVTGQLFENVLVVSPVTIWPADRGNKVRILGMIRALHSLGYRVHLVQLATEPNEIPQRLLEIKLCNWCKTVRTVPHPRLRKIGTNRWSWEWSRVLDRCHGRQIGGRKDCPSALCRCVSEVVVSENIDLAIVNYARLAVLCDALRPSVSTVCDTHDVQYLRESSLRRALKQGWAKASAYRKQELSLLERFDYLFAISRSELQYFDRHIGSGRAFYIPLNLPALPYEPSPTRGPVLFIGSLRKENIISLRWFLLKVFPRVRRRLQYVVLRVVGGTGKGLEMWAGRDVEVVGYAKSINEHLAKASCSIAPVQAGGGMKVKVVEALAAGRAVVTTSCGAEGIDLVHGRDAWIADDAVNFAEGICRLLTSDDYRHRMEQAGLRIYRESFSEETQGQRLRSAFEEIYLGSRARQKCC